MAGEQFGQRLYHREDVFILRDISGSVEVNEPIGWDKILISIDFDKTTNGFKFEFTDKDVTLGFDEAAGRSVLESNYKTYGVDAEVYLGFGSIIDDTLVLDFEMRLAFDSYESGISQTNISAERNSFGDILRTRFDVEVSLERTTTMDGMALPVLPKVNTWLSPVRVQAKDDMIFNDLFTDEEAVLTPFDPPGDDDHILLSVPPFKRPTEKPPDDSGECVDQVQTQKIEGMQEPTEPDGLLIASVPFTHGELNRKFGIEVRTPVTVDFSPNAGGDVHVVLILYKKNILDGGDPPVSSLIPGQVVDISEINIGAIAGSHTALPVISGGVQLEKDEQLFILLYIACIGVGGYIPLPGDVSMTYRLPASWYLRVTENTNPAASLVAGYRLFEAVNRQLEIILNKRNVLKSNFLGRTDLGYDENGCGSHHVTFNGKMLRGGCSSVSTFTMSAKNNFTGLDALYCMGMSVERDIDGVECVRLEPLEYFFRDVEIYSFEVIKNDYSRSNAPDYIWNELKFGYEKFPNNGQDQSLNEWLTQLSYLTPIKTVKNKLEKLCGFILSTLYIQLTRDQSFLVKPAATFETDKDNFLLGIRDDEESGSGGDTFGPYGIVWDDMARTITLDDWNFPVVKGDFIIVLTGLNAAAYQVGKVETQTPPLSATIISVTSAIPAAGSSSSEIQIFGGGRFLPRLKEDFGLVTGILFPETKFNLEHSIKRIFYRWSKVFRSGLTEKSDSETIKFTDGEINTAFSISTKVDGYSCDPPSAAYPDPREFADGADEGIGQLDKALFKSNRIIFSAPTTWAQINEWRKCFEGRHATKNYGYFSWINPDKVLEKGWLQSLKFDPVKQIAKFTFIEKPATV